MMSVAAICELLKEKIRSFLVAKNESIRWLSRQVSMSYSTIYRLHSGEQQNLDFQGAKAILSYIEPESADSILADFYPREMKSGVKTASADKALEILADNLTLFRVFAYAEANSPGREAIQKKYGEDGSAHLDRLLAMGALIDSADGFKSTIDVALYPKEEIIKKLGMHNYAMVSLDNPGTLLEAFRGGLTPKGSKGAFYAVEECRDKLEKIYAEEKGTILFVASLLAGPGEMT